MSKLTFKDDGNGRCINCGISQNNHFASIGLGSNDCESVLNWFIAYRSVTTTSSVIATWKQKLANIQAIQNTATPNSGLTNVGFKITYKGKPIGAVDNVKPDNGCECGAHKVYGIGKGVVGHSDWCPWKK